MGAVSAQLERKVVTTSRLLEFCSIKELTLQTGHPVDEWPLAAAKELVDNCLDACEGHGASPEITVDVRSDPHPSISVRDNGPGIPPETVAAMLDFTVRASSNEAYVAPTHGAQGNALKTLVAMAFALDGSEGETIIEARGVRHEIRFSIDHIRQVPRLEHKRAVSDVKDGTLIDLKWPASARSVLETAKPRFLQIVENYAWLNPHLSLRISWNEDRHEILASNCAWAKWRPSDPAPPHWYDTQRLERLIAAYVASDEDGDQTRTVREFISEFRGLSGTGKQKAVLENTGFSRIALADLFSGGTPNRDAIAKLLTNMQNATRPIKPQDLGLIGKDHIACRFADAGADLETFNYKRTLRDDNGLPSVIEMAFAYCPNGLSTRRIITGVNWSVGINNPFRQLGANGESLDTFLQEQRVGRNEPILLLIHLASPRVTFTDRGKSTLVLRGETTETSDENDDNE
jgi:DNA topoisomerase VI subunit B